MIRARARRSEQSPEHLAEILRERIYGGIACLSTLLVLTNHLGEGTTAWVAVIDVGIAALSLWAASLLADLVGDLAAHGRVERGEARRAFQASGQILEASGVPVLLLVLAGFGVLRLEAALRAGTIVSVVTLGLFALLAARRTGLVWWKRWLVVAALVGLGALVVLVKTLAHG